MRSNLVWTKIYCIHQTSSSRLKGTKYNFQKCLPNHINRINTWALLKILLEISGNISSVWSMDRCGFVVINIGFHSTGAAGIADLSQCHLLGDIFEVCASVIVGTSICNLISDSLCPVPASETPAAHMKWFSHLITPEHWSVHNLFRIKI